MGGKPCEGWQYNVTLVKSPMESFTLWVSQASAFPVQLIQEITPYGVDMATSATLFSDFTSGAQDLKLFVVPNAASCPMSRACNSGTSLRNHMSFQPKKLQSKTGSRFKQVPQLPSNWQAQQVSNSLQTEGFAVQTRPGLWCCQGSCSIQTQFGRNEYYMDVKNNRTRNDDLDEGTVIIDDYTARKQIQVKSASDLTCVSYCDIDWSLSPYQLDSNASDLGPVSIGGRTYEAWQWSVFSKLHREVEIVTVYVDQSNMSMPVPFLETDRILVPSVQDANISFSNYSAGVPAASFFAYTGLSTCKPSHSCPM